MPDSGNQTLIGIQNSICRIFMESKCAYSASQKPWYVRSRMGDVALQHLLNCLIVPSVENFLQMSRMYLLPIKAVNLQYNFSHDFMFSLSRSLVMNHEFLMIALQYQE